MKASQGRWRLWMAIAVLQAMGCDGLWSPFLMERESIMDEGIFAIDMTTGSDGSLAQDMTEVEVRPSMKLIPKGVFIMGSPTTEAGRLANEVQHMVTLTTDFWMAESEVTQRQYRNLMGRNPSYFQGDDLPVENVSWIDAIAYCNALSAKESLPPCYQISGTTVGWTNGAKCTGYRLPTEAEWEYVARSPVEKVYAGSDTVDGVAWYSGNAGSKTHAVRTKAPNGRGLFDLSGNVWEWVWDWYQVNYEASPVTDPSGPSVQPASDDRVVRGGSWDYAAPFARVAQRNENLASGGLYSLGIRIVRSNP